MRKFLICSLILFFAPVVFAQSNEAAEEKPDQEIIQVEPDEESVQPEAQDLKKEVEESEKDSCIPQCSPGYTCHYGVCLSACNPPCPHLSRCTQDLQCEPMFKIVQEQRQDELILRKKPDPQEVHLEKKRQHKLLRLSINNSVMMAGFLSMDVLMASYKTGLGLRRNFTDQLGAQLSANIAMGSFFTASYDDSSYTDSRSGFLGYEVELIPYFAPSNAVAIGPLVWVMGLYPFNRDISDPYDESVTYSLERGHVVGTGLDFRFFVGRKDQYSIFWQVKSNFTDQWPFSFTLGFSAYFPTSY